MAVGAGHLCGRAYAACRHRPKFRPSISHAKAEYVPALKSAGLYSRDGQALRPGAASCTSAAPVGAGLESATVKLAAKWIVLVIDDEPLIRGVLSELLRDAGYEVATAENGRSGLALLEASPVDVILLDLMMPVMDGSAFRARQLEDPALANIPVILLSASYNVDLDRLSPWAYLAKPFDLAVLLDAVEAACTRAP